MNKSFALTFSFGEKTIASITFAWLLITYHLIFREYFPLANGHMGHDYGQFLPALIDNYFWFMNNGLFSPPWFSPAFCGGQVNFADPQSMYYSLPQFLVFTGISPIQSVYLSVIIFASIGFWGMLWLTRDGFKLSIGAALTCAAIFMYNGFFIYRMIVGHFTYQGFMLIPLITYLLISKPVSNSHLSFWASSIFAGCLLAYWCATGMLVIVIPCLLSILAIILLYILYNEQNDPLLILKKSFIAAIVTLSLSASKLVGAATLMTIFPRTQYPLPGFDTIIALFKVFFSSLFFSTDFADAINKPLWKNNTLLRLPDEYAFGLTVIPLIIIGVSVLCRLRKRSKCECSFNLKHKLILLVLLIIGLIPFLLNYYDYSWNAFLKTLPIISATTSPLRWLLIYIFIIIIVCGIAHHLLKDSIRNSLAFICIAALPILILMENKDYYHAQPYEAFALEKEFSEFKLSGNQPAITNNIMVPPTPDVRQNSYLVQGAGALNCYNPTYGYSLEKAEFRTLAVGSVMALMSPTTLNIRNPACIIFPQENNCKLWDNFSTDQAEMAGQFLTYKPFAFERSQIQHMADLISTIAVFVVALFFLIYFLIFLNSAGRTSGRRNTY